MTRWTDEQVMAELRETFAAHERDVDAATAHRIALTTGPASRKRWPVLAAAAAVVVVLVGVTLYAVHVGGSTQEATTTPSPIEVPIAAVKGTNRALARAEAARVLAAIPVPPGSTRSASPPAPFLRRLEAYDGSVDPSLTRTRWWVVPLSTDDLVAWYDAHTPAETGGAYYPGATRPAPRGGLDWQIHSSSDAYSTPAVVVSYARLDADTTAIRTDATLAARYDRTAETLVPRTVTSIDITKQAIDGPDTTPTTSTVDDPALISNAATDFNKLEGAMAHARQFGCGSPAGLVYVYAVTFHWPGHTLAVDAGSSLCGIGRGLTLDGSKLPQTLQDDAALDNALQDALDAA